MLARVWTSDKRTTCMEALMPRTKDATKNKSAKNSMRLVSRRRTQSFVVFARKSDAFFAFLCSFFLYRSQLFELFNNSMVNLCFAPVRRHFKIFFFTCFPTSLFHIKILDCCFREAFTNRASSVVRHFSISVDTSELYHMLWSCTFVIVKTCTRHTRIHFEIKPNYSMTIYSRVDLRLHSSDCDVIANE